MTGGGPSLSIFAPCHRTSARSRTQVHSLASASTKRALLNDHPAVWIGRFWLRGWLVVRRKAHAQPCCAGCCRMCNVQGGAGVGTYYGVGWIGRVWERSWLVVRRQSASASLRHLQTGNLSRFKKLYFFLKKVVFTICKCDNHYYIITSE